MIFSRILSILPFAVTMTLTVLPSSTHGQYDCDFLELIPDVCEAEGAEYDTAKSCIENNCLDEFTSLMPQIQHFLEDAENPSFPDKDCTDVNVFMKNMIETCGSCTESLVRLVDCAAEHETKMNDGSKEEILKFINILKESENDIGMTSSTRILRFIRGNGSCQNLLSGGYVIEPPAVVRERPGRLFDGFP